MADLATATINVELHVDDFDPAKDFYGAFGFEVIRQQPPRNDKGYLVLRSGGQVLCFWPGTNAVSGQPYFSRFDQSTTPGFRVELVIQVADLDEAFAEATRRNAVVAELQLKPWGLRDFRMVDPYGFYVRVNEPFDVLES